MIFFPPKELPPKDHYRKSIFLAGTIDMGNSRDWQAEIGSHFDSQGWDVFNPRREDWDSSWEQTIRFPKFKQQVLWEMYALNHADYVVFNFLPDSESPITMMELGLMAAQKYEPNKTPNISVICPEQFWRKGNVDILCEVYGIKVYTTELEFLTEFDYK